MGNLFYVGLGGFIGAIMRFWITGKVQDWSGSVGFPYGTLAVNLLGCFSLGVLSYLIDTRGWFSPETRAVVVIGLLGAFTTFSTFSLESFNLLTSGELNRGLLNIGGSVLLGLAAIWAGRTLPWLLWR